MMKHGDSECFGGLVIQLEVHEHQVMDIHCYALDENNVHTVHLSYKFYSTVCVIWLWNIYQHLPVF